MLSPISYISDLHCGPSAVDIGVAIDTYADRLAGRRRCFDMSITTLSVATLRDVDDGTRGIRKALASWLVDAPIREEEAAAAANDNKNNKDNKYTNDDDDNSNTTSSPSTTAPNKTDLKGKRGGRANVVDGTNGTNSNNCSDDDDDALIITSDAPPTTGLVRRGGCATHSAYSHAPSFVELAAKASYIRGPSLPEWERLLFASAGHLRRAAAAEEEKRGCGGGVRGSALECSNSTPTPNSCPIPTSPTCIPIPIAFGWASLDLSYALDQRLVDELGVERFDMDALPNSEGYASGAARLDREEVCPWAKGCMGPLANDCGDCGCDGVCTCDPTVVTLGGADHHTNHSTADGCGHTVLCPSPSPPFRARLSFPNLTSLDLSYTRISSIDAFTNCATLKYLRLVNTIGVRRVPKGLVGLVTFEAERCFHLEDIHTGLSGLPLLELISIDEAVHVRRLPTRLPALVQLNISRTDGLSWGADVSGETFADPASFPALEELFIHGQRTIRQLCPMPDSPDAGAEREGAEEKAETSARSPPPTSTTCVGSFPLPILPKLQILVASESVVEGLEAALAGHAALKQLTLGPHCTAVPPGLAAIERVCLAGCTHVTSLAPLIGSTTLESLDISETDGLLDLVDGAGADEDDWPSEDEDEDEDGADGEEGGSGGGPSLVARALSAVGGASSADGESCGVSVALGGDKAETLSVASASAAAVSAVDGQLHEENDEADSSGANIIKVLLPDAAAASTTVHGDEKEEREEEGGGVEDKEEEEEAEEVEEGNDDEDALPEVVLPPFPLFPSLTHLTARGASVRSLRPLTNSAFLEVLDISETRGIRAIPEGLASLAELDVACSDLRTMDALEGSRSLQTLRISHAERLRCLPRLPAIERINDHKANFFLKMYVVAGLQRRGARMYLKEMQQHHQRYNEGENEYRDEEEAEDEDGPSPLPTESGGGVEPAGGHGASASHVDPTDM